MEEKDVDLWWDAVKDIVWKDIGKVCRKYAKNERLYRHEISRMEKVMPSFEYEPLVMSPKLKTSNEEKDRGDTNGVRPLGIIVAKEPRNLIRGKDSLEREAIEHTLEQEEYVLQEVSS
jgi:hypothetical protein